MSRVTVTMYVVDEALLPPERARGTPDVTPEALETAIRRDGGRWSGLDVGQEQFEAAFAALDGFTGGGEFLSALAVRGSPHHVLVGHPDPWRFGYFERSLVPHLAGAVRLQATALDAALSRLDQPAQAVAHTFIQALDEASERGLAVALLHERR